MALNRIYINNDLSKLADAIRSFNYYDTVEYTNNNGQVVLCKIGNDTQLRIECTAGLQYTITAYNSQGDSLVLANSVSTGITYAYTCTNGIIFGQNFSTSAYLRLIITKTNNNVPVIIYNYSYSQEASFKVIAWDDIVPFKEFSYRDPDLTYYPTTIIVPFTTNSNIDYLSYTPNAGYILQKPLAYNGFYKLVIGNDIYISDGFWVIKD